jgi:hypothetical protein
MDHQPLTFSELFIVVSATVQIAVIVFSFFFYKILSINEKRIWKWFVISMSFTLIRRFFVTIRYLYDYPTSEIESAITIIISICWIMFVYKFISKKMAE